MLTIDEPKDHRTDEELAAAIRQLFRAGWATVNELESRGWVVEINPLAIHRYGSEALIGLSIPDIKITKTKSL